MAMDLKWPIVILLIVIFIMILSSNFIPINSVGKSQKTMNFVISPGKQPTILLEAGQGEDSSAWSKVQSMLEKETNNQIISYDREGFGKSSVDNSPYNIENEVNGLEKGLNALGVNGGLIYVAHSYGAFLAQIYSERNPGKIVAIVLVDPNNYCFNNNGGFSTVWSPPPYNKLSIPNERVIMAYPKTVEFMGKVHQFPKDIPVTVISSGKPPAGNLTELWRNCHKEIINGNPDGKFLIAENSSHLIQIDDPKIIVEEVRDILYGIMDN